MEKDFFFEVETKKKKSNEDDHQNSNWTEALPKELILEIMSRLPITSVIQFRFVCKTFLNLSHDPALVEMHLSRSSNVSTYLIFHCNYPLNNQLHFVEFLGNGNFATRGKRFQIPFSNSMPEFNVVGSCNGLLCMVNSLFGDEVYIYNPFTRHYRVLPKSIEYEDQEVMYGFGFHPGSKEYKVIKIIYYTNMYNSTVILPISRVRRYLKSEVQVFSLRGKKWRSIGEMDHQFDRRSTVALVGGRLHWLTTYGRSNREIGKKIISFDISDDRFRVVPRPGRMNRMNMRDCHLAVLRGCLSVAVPSHVTYDSLEIWIMREYEVKESWENLFCIDAYSPRLMSRELDESYNIWRNVLTMRSVRVLCLLESGEVLLEYKGGTLACFNPESRTFRNLMFSGMPSLCETNVHIGSLNWIN